jgi:hypothetical protein
MIESAGKSHNIMLFVITGLWDFWDAIIIFPFIIVGLFASAVPRDVLTVEVWGYAIAAE